MTTTKTKADEAFDKAQAEMHALEKNQTNPHFRSKYADLSAVHDASRESLRENGFTVRQFTAPRSDEPGYEMVTQLVHEGEIYIEDRTPLILAKNDMQGLGAAQTYARRYGLLDVTGLAPVDDDGNGAVANGRDPSAPRTPGVAASRRVANGTSGRGAATEYSEPAF